MFGWKYLLLIANLCCDDISIEIFLCTCIEVNQISARVFLHRRKINKLILKRQKTTEKNDDYHYDGKNILLFCYRRGTEKQLKNCRYFEANFQNVLPYMNLTYKSWPSNVFEVHRIPVKSGIRTNHPAYFIIVSYLKRNFEINKKKKKKEANTEIHVHA